MSAVNTVSRSAERRVIVALDCDSGAAAQRIADRLDPANCRLKVGKELFTRSGPALVERLVNSGFDVFLDLKFHDIPNTVAGACRAAAGLGVWMINVHALGGRRMLEAAAAAVRDVPDRPLLTAVTLLTSLDEPDLIEVGLGGSPMDHVRRLAQLARACGLDGVVCSAREAAELRRSLPDDFCIVTPGIRTAGAAADDQRRVMTPAAAIAAGADFLVIGRSITAAPDPAGALEQINNEIAGALVGVSGIV